MQEEIQNIKSEALSRILEAEDGGELEQIRIDYLGRKGKIATLTKDLKNLSTSKKKSAGQLINEVKSTIEHTLSSQKNKLKESAREWFDATIPGKKQKLGNLHLVTQAIDEISSVFERIGFVRSRYPEVEWDWFAFGALNFSQWHPARDEWETFLIDTNPHKKNGPMVLTPHTSSGQIREMQRVGTPPIRMINITKCYRRQSDVSHVPMFHQFEGLVIDKDVNITNLKGTLDYFARNFFGKGRKTRIRPYNFPFTEPSFEVDIDCVICMGTGRLKTGAACRVCKGGWLELGGAGMVHPEVLKNGGINPAKFTGFAFGWGVERVFMMKSDIKIPDIRLLYNSDLKFLKQF